MDHEKHIFSECISSRPPNHPDQPDQPDHLITPTTLTLEQFANSLSVTKKSIIKLVGANKLQKKVCDHLQTKRNRKIIGKKIIPNKDFQNLQKTSGKTTNQKIARNDSLQIL